MQAAHSRRVHTALGEHGEVEAQLNSVVELMLDITESSVAFCWELGSGAAMLIDVLSNTIIQQQFRIGQWTNSHL